MNSSEVNFIQLSEEKYQSLENKEVGTFYLTECNLYLGQMLLTSNIATQDTLGIVKPDNESIQIDEEGQLHITWGQIYEIIKSVPSQDISEPTIYTGGLVKAKFANYDSNTTDVTGDTAINAGNYIAEFTPKTGYAWVGEDLSSKEVPWKIDKLQGEIEVDTSDITLDSSNLEKQVEFNLTGDGEVSAISSDESIVTSEIIDNKISIAATQESGNADVSIEVSEGVNYLPPEKKKISVICNFNAALIKPLNECTWADVATISNDGNAQKSWNIGDTKLAYFKNKSASTIFPLTMRLVGWNDYKMKVESSYVDSNAIFISDECIPDLATCMGTQNDDSAQGLSQSLTIIVNSIQSTPGINDSVIEENILNYCKETQILLDNGWTQGTGSAKPCIPRISDFNTDGTGLPYYTNKSIADLIKCEAGKSTSVDYLLLADKGQYNEMYSNNGAAATYDYITSEGVVKRNEYIPYSPTSTSSYTKFTNLRSPIVITF